MAARVQVTVFLNTPYGNYEITQYISQEMTPQVTWAIEAPTEVSSFVAPDLTIRGRDKSSGLVRGLLRAIQPISTNYRVYVYRSIDFTGGGTFTQDMNFSGVVLPNSVQMDDAEGWFSFTAVEIGRLLATTPATDLFKSRFLYSGKWTLAQDASPLSNAINVVGAGTPSTCDFRPGDQAQIASVNSKGDIFTVLSVTANSAPPVSSWYVVLSGNPSATAIAGSAVNILTPYDHSVSMSDMVTTLFAAVPDVTGPGLGYQVSALPGTTSVFASPVNLNGLTGTVLGIAPSVAAPFGQGFNAVTPDGLWTQATPPTGTWSLVSSSIYAPLIDASNYGPVSLSLYGSKRIQTRISNPKKGLNVTYTYFGYDFWKTTTPYNRYRLVITCNADTATGLGPYSFSIVLKSETSTDGLTWGSLTTVWAGETDTTADDLTQFWDGFGIDVDPATGTVFFSDITVGGSSGAQATFNISAYQPGVGIARNKASNVRGVPIFTAPGRLSIFATDGLLGQSPIIKGYTTVANGTMTARNSVSSSPYVVGRSVKYNPGSGFWYGLVSHPTNGIYIRIWSSDDFFVAGFADVLISPPPPPPPDGQYSRPFECDLVVWRDPAAVGAKPMFALIGTTPYYIDTKGSGLIDYADMTGLSIADALQQLSILAGGYFFLSNFFQQRRWQFWTRNISLPTASFDNGFGSDQMDDPRILISKRSQPVWQKTCLYVRVENENDPTIYGEAGNVAYAEDDSLSMKVACRFLSTSTFAQAIASGIFAYLGAQKRVVEITTRTVPTTFGQIYQLGWMFHANVDGANRQFRIIEVSSSLFSNVWKVLGVEL